MSRPGHPSRIQKELQKAADITRGLATHGLRLGLTQIAGDFQVALQHLKDADAALADARTEKILAAKRVMLADRALGGWLAKARLVVMLVCGPRWSEGWADSGFINRRTHVPKGRDSRIALARSLVRFFARNPEFGVAFANVTAAQGRGIYERVTQSFEILQLMNVQCANLKRQCDIAKQTFRQLIWQLVGLLSETIGQSDPRWADFGLKHQKLRGKGAHALASQHEEPETHNAVAA